MKACQTLKRRPKPNSRPKGCDELEAVIKLLDSALEQGLDKDNTEFAEQLLVASLLEHATALSSTILDRPVPDLSGTAPLDRRGQPKRALAIDDGQVQAHLLLGKTPVAARRGPREGPKVTRNGHCQRDIRQQNQGRGLYLPGKYPGESQAKTADYDQAVEMVPEDAEIRRTRAMFHLRNDRHDRRSPISTRHWPWSPTMRRRTKRVDLRC